MPESEYGMFLEYQEMKDKHDYLQQFGVDTDEDIARTLAMFGGFTEGLQLFASFAMLMNFPRFNKMKGMGQIVSWSVRDESLHCEGITRLFHAFVKRTRLPDQGGEGRHHRLLPEDRAAGGRLHRPRLRKGPVPGMSAKEIKRYIRYIADWRLGQLGLQPIYMIDDHPLPWLDPAAQRRRARQLLRNPRHRILQGRHPRRTGTTCGATSTRGARPRGILYCIFNIPEILISGLRHKFCGPGEWKIPRKAH
jgi:hypothetical protein